MKAMLLCAGMGTRLGPLSQEKPKPLLPVCNVPILRFGIANLVARGVTEIVINLHHQGPQIREELGDGSSLGASICYSEEEEILGTGGGLKKALSLLDPDARDEPFVCLNGKLIFDVDVQAVLQTHLAATDSLGTMVVRPAPNALQWGAVDVQPEGQGMRVHNILEQGSYMFSGVHITRPSTIAMLPDGEACMVRQGYLPWIKKGQRVSAYVQRGGYFAEHSTPKRYLQSNLDLLAADISSHAPAALRGIDASAQIDPSATIEQPVCIGAEAVIEAGCRIGPNVVIGGGAQIAAQTRLRECVVWSGTAVSGEHQQAILTPHSVIAANGADDVDS